MSNLDSDLIALNLQNPNSWNFESPLEATLLLKDNVIINSIQTLSISFDNSVQEVLSREQLFMTGYPMF